MRIAYFDCFSGVSGDMTLGALIACGVSVDDLKADLARLNLPGWELKADSVSRNGIGAIDVTVSLTQKQGHGRHLHHIEEILNAADIPADVRAKARDVFRRLAVAEAKVHQTTVESIHFHEVGAVDAIVDIVGSCFALERLGVERIVCAPLALGHGFVNCAHGMIPLPAPAVVELTTGYPVRSVDVEGETVTPTGAALMTTLAAEFGLIPAMTVRAVGYGAGKSDFGDRPNLLRVVIGDTIDDDTSDEDAIAVIETNIDDMPSQHYELLSERLFAAGAVDVFLTAIQMKKNRPATLVTVLAPEDKVDAVVDVIFTETTTLGVRFRREQRRCQERTWVSVETAYGAIRIKVGSWRGAVKSVTPEYDDAKAAARAYSVPLKAVHEAAMAAYRKYTG